MCIPGWPRNAGAKIPTHTCAITHLVNSQICKIGQRDLQKFLGFFFKKQHFLNENLKILIGCRFRLHRCFVLKNTIDCLAGPLFQVISGSAVLYWAYNYLLGVNNHRSNFLIFFTLNFFLDFLTSNFSKDEKNFALRLQVSGY